MNRIESIVSDSTAEGIRVDQYVASYLSVVPRSRFSKHDVRAVINGQEAKYSKRISVGDRIEVYWEEEAPAPSFRAEPIPLDIIFENESVIVVHKPAGMVVHPAAGNYTGTLVQGLLYHCVSLKNEFGHSTRPGIVHRLDKDTSGVIIAAKNTDAHRYLAAQFKRKKVSKTYYALVKGIVGPRDQTVSKNLIRDPRNRKRFTTSDSTGKKAVTEIRRLAVYGDYTFLSLTPITGRTHQLRVHLKSLGHPILGDPVYSRPDARFPDSPLMLHAYCLTIRLPGEDIPREFRAPFPETYRNVLKKASLISRGERD